MKYINAVLSKDEINQLINDFGNYIKLTVDVEKRQLVAGCELHADGEKTLLEKGSNQDNVWGGGINLLTKQIDATAVLNLRPRLNNDSLELLDPVMRNNFFSVGNQFL